MFQLQAPCEFKHSFLPYNCRMVSHVHSCKCVSNIHIAIHQSGSAPRTSLINSNILVPCFTTLFTIFCNWMPFSYYKYFSIVAAKLVHTWAYQCPREVLLKKQPSINGLAIIRTVCIGQKCQFQTVSKLWTHVYTKVGLLDGFPKGNRTIAYLRYG